MEGDGHSIYQYAKREGQTGLELDLLRLHYSRVTPDYGCRLVNAVLAALQEAAANAPAEIAAATKIQTTFRMHRQRQAYQAIRDAACAIQRVYRGYTTRKVLEVEAATVRHTEYLQTVFDMFATRIQACFRGYRSRKVRANYYAQQAYLRIVTTRSAEVLAQAHCTKVEQDALRTAEAKRVHDAAYADRTAHMHYMVSTCSLPSVYQCVVALPEAKPGVETRVPTPPEKKKGRSRSAETSGRAHRHSPANAGAGETASESAAEERFMAQVAAYTAGAKLEDDIRLHARAARRERHRGRSKAPQPSAALADAPAEPTDAASSQVPRLPALTASMPAPRQPPGKTNRTPPVPWEMDSSRPPQRPLVPRTPPIAGPSLSQSAPAAPSTSRAPPSGGSSLGRTLRKEQKPAVSGRGTSTADTAVADVAAPTGASSAAAQAFTETVSELAVSSFSRRFGVKRHDCLDHQLSTTNGVTSDAAPSYAATIPLSTAKEDAAVERSVNQQVVQALHGNTVFKVPAGRGRR